MNNELALNKSNEILDLFEKIELFDNSKNVAKIKKSDFPEGDDLQFDEMCFFKVKQLSFDEDYPRREAFENVLMSLDDSSFNFVYILTGNKTGVDLTIGIVKNGKQSENRLNANDYGKIIQNIFEGNFSGSELVRLKGENLRKNISGITEQYKSAGIIVGVPSINENKYQNDYDFQGIDRLINSMLGLEWRLVVVCEPTERKKIIEMRDDIYNLYNRLSVASKTTLQRSTNMGESTTEGGSTSDSWSKNMGVNESSTDSKGSSSGSSSSSQNKGTSHTKGTSSGTSESHSTSKNHSVGYNKGSSSAVTIELANKKAQEVMSYIDDELLKRIKTGICKGLYQTSVYYMAKNPAEANRLKSAIISLFQGDVSTYSPLKYKTLDLENIGGASILKNYQNRYEFNKSASNDVAVLHSRPYENEDESMGLNTFLTASEISLIAGLPQKEVPGIVLRESSDFGLNENQINVEDSINLGCMVQKGRELKDIPFFLSKKSLSKHTFIAGVTGSGKTTTCQRLLTEAEVPFLVIEPAKTEYRSLLNQDKEITVFTLGNETVAPFRLNPFELIKGEVLSSHVDMLKATFTSAFPMEASMPQILEESIYECYKRKGWDVDTNENTIYGEAAFDDNVDSFPILSELLLVMDDVVNTKNFGNELKNNYKGSLVSRLSNLTVGSKGAMINCSHSMDFNYIADHNVVFEMEDLKSPEDKALFMGFILSRLSVVIKQKYENNKNYKHLTLVEEAHRLLSKPDFSDGGAKKSAVETFTDLLAEVRKYGEGLIIVDQIPNKLAPEVLKNTNTKIIHKILARDDKEAVGDTMLMDDKQKKYLSALDVGNAVIFSEDTKKPVQVKINRISDEECVSTAEITNKEVRERFNKNKNSFGSCYEMLIFTPLIKKFKDVAENLRKCCTDYRKNKNILVNSKRIKELLSDIGEFEKENQCDEKDIWKILVHNLNLANGFSINNTLEDKGQKEEMRGDIWATILHKIGKTDSNTLKFNDLEFESEEKNLILFNKLGGIV